MSSDQQDKKHPDDSSKGVSRRTVIGAAGSLGLAAAALTAGVPRRAEAQTAPEGGFFALEIPDFLVMDFPEARGIGSETVIDNGVRGVQKWSSIELKRGVDSSRTLWNWRKMVEDGRINEARKNGSIVLLDYQQAEVGRWNFEHGWPSKIEWGGFDQLRSQVETPPVSWEALTLTVENLKRVR